MSVDLPAGERPAASPGPERPADSGSRLRVLVLDDEPLVGRAVSRLLQAEHDVEVLTSPPECARRAEAGERWDVVLCDLIMPEMTGMELHARLREAAPGVAERMVFMTGGAFTAAASTFLEEPDRRWIEKPVDAAELRRVVREVGGAPRE